MRFLNLAIAYDHVAKRTGRYTRGKETNKRLKELEKDVKNHKNTLFIIVFDEAHYG